jgi:hypothetical protein
VREHGELPVQYAAGTKSSNAGSHARSAVGIETRLRPVGRLQVLQRLRRRAGQPEFLGYSSKLVPSGNDLRGLCFFFQLYRYRFRVSVLDCHAVALCAHGELAWRHAVSIQSSQQLASLLLHLLFFFRDVRDDITQNVERCDPRVSRSADGLHGDRHHSLQFESLVQWSERDDQPDGRAIRIGDYEASALSP